MWCFSQSPQSGCGIHLHGFSLQHPEPWCHPRLGCCFLRVFSLWQQKCNLLTPWYIHPNNGKTCCHQESLGRETIDEERRLVPDLCHKSGSRDQGSLYIIIIASSFHRLFWTTYIQKNLKHFVLLCKRV